MNKIILRNQEQIKANQVDIKNTLAVVMSNTIPPNPDASGLKQHFSLPVSTPVLFTNLNHTLKHDKVKRLEMVN